MYRHDCRWRVAKFSPMLKPYGLNKRRDLYRATHVNRDLGFCGLIPRTSPISPFWRQVRATKDPSCPKCQGDLDWMWNWQNNGVIIKWVNRCILFVFWVDFQCYTCKDQTCQSQELTACSSGSHYCMSTVKQDQQGGRIVTKGCVERWTPQSEGVRMEQKIVTFTFQNSI